MDIGLFVKKRKELKISQVRLSDGICTQATLSKFENNGHVPSIEILTKLCDRLGLNVDELFKKTAIKSVALDRKLNQIETELMTEDYQTVLQDLDQIDEDQITAVVAQMQFYYLRGIVNTLVNREVEEISFDFSVILNDLDAGQKTIFTPLAFLGSGIMYHRLHQPKRADFYFEKVNHFIEEILSSDEEDARGQHFLRVLMLIYYCAAYYADRDELERSCRLVKNGIQLCSEQHVTYYLPNLKLLALKNAIRQKTPTDQIQTLMDETLAFAKLNQNDVIQVKLAALKCRFGTKQENDIELSVR